MNSSREHILTRLSLSNSPLSGDVLASELGLSRAGIWKHIEALRNSGADIQAHVGLGYVLNSEVFSAGALKARLNCKRIGHQIRILEETGSKNVKCALEKYHLDPYNKQYKKVDYNELVKTFTVWNSEEFRRSNKFA